MSDLSSAFQLVFNTDTLLWIAIGDILGIILGALPGLTATMGMALMLPISYYLSPAASMGLMLGVYFGAVCGASIPAVLFGIPGNPNAIATVYDGYAMSKKGEGGIALGTAVVGSFIGGLGSTIILIIAAPLLASVALAFGPAEYFALALTALTIIAAASGQSVLKGMLAGALGICLAMVGMDNVSGIPRFTFGNVYLMEGLGLIPALIGLFGIAQALQDLNQVRAQATEVIMPKLGKLMPSMKWVAARWRTIVESTFLGTLVGTLPGAGASVGVVLAYQRAKDRSSNPDEFGKGKLEGVFAPEVANNACIGGGLIPTLALGIPGESAAVMLMAALIMQGITPGPLLFSQHLDLVYTIFIAMIVANVCMMVFQLAGVRLFARALMIPPYLLSVLVLVLSLMGAYALKAQVFDAAVALGFGVLGWVLKRAEYPVIPVVLGLILGPMIESGFRRAIMLGSGSWTVFFDRPITLLLFSLATLAIGREIIARRRARRAAAA